MVAVQVGEEDRLALFEGQLEERLLDAVAHGHALHVVPGRLARVGEVDGGIVRASVHRQGIVGAPAQAAAQLVLALVGGDAQQPAPQVAPFEASD